MKQGKEPAWSADRWHAHSERWGLIIAVQTADEKESLASKIRPRKKRLIRTAKVDAN
jgi:hypothetical protein